MTWLPFVLCWVLKQGRPVQEASVPPVDYVRLPDIEQVVEQEVAPAAPQQLGGWEQHTFSLREVFSGVWILFLLLLLGIQYVWFNLDALAADDAWRPTVERFCGVLGCAVPLRSDADQLAIISRDVRQHPTTDGALLINASFENRADFVQRYPVFEISFTDSDGRPVARRRFLPNEYVADAAAVAGGLLVGRNRAGSTRGDGSGRPGDIVPVRSSLVRLQAHMYAALASGERNCHREEWRRTDTTM